MVNNLIIIMLTSLKSDHLAVVSIVHLQL